MKNNYKVLKLNELADQLGLPSSKGYKTKDYLELVIGEIEDRGYRFVQFFQLIDVLYVIINTGVPKETPYVEEFNPTAEIRNHYRPVQLIDEKPQTKRKVEKEAETANVAEEALDNIKKRDHLDKNLKAAALPWKK
jgi:hypothetical protein